MSTTTTDRHNWTEAQRESLEAAVEIVEEVGPKECYQQYRARFGRHAATYNQFRTSLYIARKRALVSA